MSIKYYFKGITDTVTVCDCCGKQNLKKTVALVPDDGAGNLDYDEVAFFGSQCAKNFLFDRGQKKESEKVNNKTKFNLEKEYLLPVFNGNATYRLTTVNGEFMGHSIKFADSEDWITVSPARFISLFENQITDQSIKNILQDYYSEIKQ